MPLPFEYQNASRQFDQFMVDCRDNAGLATTNMTWNMVVGVLHAYRSRLTLEQALRFANVLPPVIRAIFVEDWTPAPPKPFGTTEQMMADVRAVRHRHNFATSNAIHAVAAALRKQIDMVALMHVLAQFPPEAQQYWLAEYPPAPA
jgi:uncharacterized protein (DUF2267 family)